MIILKGNLLETPFEIIAHQVNCQGKMNSGVAKQIREKFPIVYDEYMEMIDEYGSGEVYRKSQVIYLGGHTIINLFGQFNYGYDGKQYTSYEALKDALGDAICRYRYGNHMNLTVQFTIAIPYKIGCDRGGGDWTIVKSLLEEIERDYNVVFVAYKLE